MGKTKENDNKKNNMKNIIERFMITIFTCFIYTYLNLQKENIYIIIIFYNSLE